MRRASPFSICQKRLVLLVLADPKPQDCSSLTLNSECAVVATDSHRHDRLDRMDPLEVQTRMPRVHSKELICRTSLVTNVSRKASQELAECRVRSRLQRCSGSSGSVRPASSSRI